MERRMVALLGTAAKHILGGLRRAVRAVFLTFLIVALVVGAVTEVVSSFLTHALPGGMTHLAAAALAISFGYAAAITVAIEEILRAIIKSVELIVEEAERIEKKAVQEIEVLGRKAEEEAIRLGHAAATDAGAFGHAAVHDAGAVGRAAVGDAGTASRAVAGFVGGAVGAVGGAVGGVEHGITEHLPGHHNNAPAPVTSATTQIAPDAPTQR